MRKSFPIKTVILTALQYSIALILLVCGVVRTQIYNVQGTVYVAFDPSNKTPARYANVTFIDLSDTSKHYSALTDTNGHYQISIVTRVKPTSNTIPSNIELSQYYPNPFSSSTNISYQLKKPADATVTIYNILGQEIKSFSIGAHTPQMNTLLWDGKDNFGTKAATGVYFYRLRAGGETVVKKMVFGGGSSPAPLMNILRFQTHEIKNGKSIFNTPKLFDVEIKNTDDTSPGIYPGQPPFYDIPIQNDTTINFNVAYGVCLDCPMDDKLIDSYPTWSPDGSTIAYKSSDSSFKNYGIYFINADGTNKRLWSTGSLREPRWSRDGEWIAFHWGAQIYKKKINGDSLIQLTTEGLNFSPDWSSDGKWIVYRRSYSYPETEDIQGIWIMSSDGKTRRQLFSGNAGEPSWKPNSDTIVFFRGVLDSVACNLWARNVKLNTIGAIALCPGSCEMPRFNYDGTQIAYTSHSPQGKSRIWLLSSVGTNIRQLTDRESNTCDWSPDGEWIIYTDSRYTNGRLWLIKKDGTGKHQFTF